MDSMRHSRYPFLKKLGKESTLNSIWQQHYNVHIECCHGSELFAIQMWHNSGLDVNFGPILLGFTMNIRLATLVCTLYCFQVLL